MPRKKKENTKIKLSPEALQECKEAFVLYDVDGSGAVDEGELFLAMKTLGFAPDEKEVHKMMQLADVDGNGTLDFEEFCQLVGPRMGEKESPANIERGYSFIAGRAARADIQGAEDTGQITFEDLRQIAREMKLAGEDIREEDIRALMREADLGDGDSSGAGDGEVSLEEYALVMKKAGIMAQ